MNIKSKDGSYFHNNLIIAREYDQKNGHMLIDGRGDDVVVSLNGYAIIPLEEYYELKGESLPSVEADSIEDMDKRLHDKLAKQQ